MSPRRARRARHAFALAALALVMTGAPALADGPSPSPIAEPAAAAPTPGRSPGLASRATVAPRPKAPPAPRLIGPGTQASLQPFTLSSTSMALTGFTYTGNVLVGTASGNVLAMRLVAASAAIAGLGVRVPCHAVGQGLSMQSTMAAPPSAVATAGAATEFLLTRLDYTTADLTLPAPPGGVFTWTPALPPPANLLAADAGTLSSVSAAVVGISTTSLDTPHIGGYASFC